MSSVRLLRQELVWPCKSRVPCMPAAPHQAPHGHWGRGSALLAKPPPCPSGRARNHTACLAPETNDLGCAERPHQKASPVLSETPSPSTTPIVLWSACIPGTLSPFEAGVSASAHSGQRGKPSKVVTSPTPQPPAQPNPPAFIPTKNKVPLCGLTTPKGPVQGHAQVP